MEDLNTYPSCLAFIEMGWLDEALRKAMEMDNGPKKTKCIEEIVEKLIDIGFCQDAANAAKHLPKEERKKYQWLEKTCLVQ
jgi:hypothetical protein